MLAGLFFFFFFHLTYSRWTSSLPSCLWSQRIIPSLPGSRLTFFLSRCKFSTLTTLQPMVEFHLLTFPRFPLRKKEHKSYVGKNRTHDFRTRRCAAYLLDHSGDELDCRVLEGFGIYMIGILGSLSDVVGGFFWLLLHVVHSSCNLLDNIKKVLSQSSFSFDLWQSCRILTRYIDISAWCRQLGIGV